MDTSINPVSVAGQQYTAPAIKNSETAVPAATYQTTPIVAQAAPAATDTTTSSSSQYEAALRQAALSFKNVYALSDQQFSIFKDATGKYITRYVSLRDGRITYLPEPTLVKEIQMSGADSPARVAITA